MNALSPSANEFAPPELGDPALPAPTPDPRVPAAPAPLDALRHVPVRVEAVLGRARLPIADLLALEPGSVLDLDRKVGEPVDILINDRLIARGEVVLIDAMLGVTVTEIVRQGA